MNRAFNPYRVQEMFEAMDAPAGIAIAWQDAARLGIGRGGAWRRMRLSPGLALAFAVMATTCVAVALVVAHHFTGSGPPPRPGRAPAPLTSPVVTAGPTAGGTPAASTSPQPPSTIITTPPSGAAPTAPPTVPPTSPTPPPQVDQWPDATNTGVPAGTTLTNSNGDMTITTDGQVVSGLLLNGSISVKANNVTITRSRISSTGWWAIHLYPGYHGLVVSDTEIDKSLQWGVGIDGSGLQLLRCNIHSLQTAVAPGPNSLVQDNFIHDLVPGQNGSADGISLGGIAHTVIRHNSVLVGKGGNGAIDLYPDTGPVVDVVVDDNLVAGGGYTLRGGVHAGSQQIRFTANHISRMFYANAGFYGPVGNFDANEPGNVWSGNVWDGTAQNVPPG